MKRRSLNNSRPSNLSTACSSSPFVLGAIIVGALFANISKGQDYEVLPIHPRFDPKQIINEPAVNGDPKKAASELRQRTSKISGDARKIFSGQVKMDAAFQTYYNQVVVPELTRYDRESLQTLTAKRQKIQKDFNRSITNTAVRGYLIADVFFPKLKQICEGNYHPAVRYNAILMIGDLDEVAGKSGRTAPRPFRQSLPYLISQFQAHVDPKLGYLKYGAFKGIARIAQIDAQKNFLPAPERTNAKALFNGFLKPAPKDVSKDLYEAMQRKAVEIVGMYGDATSLDSLASMIDNPAISNWTKLESAIAISRIKTQTVDAAKVEAIANSIAKLMHDSLREEVKSMTEYQKRILILAARAKKVGSAASGTKRGSTGPGGGMPGPGSMGPGGGMPGPGSMGPGGGLPGGPGGSAGPGGGLPGGPGGGAGPGSTSPAGAGGGRTARNSKAVPLENLPLYRIEIGRRRIKTIATGLYDSMRSPSDPVGILRWAKGETLPKLSKIKTLLEEADTASEIGLAADADLTESMTVAIKKEFTAVADKLADFLGIEKESDSPKVETKTSSPLNN